MKALNKDELNQVSGGLISTYGGKYYAITDTGDAYYTHGSKNKQDIIEICKEQGWGTEEISPEEFEKRFGYEFEAVVRN